MGTSDESRLEGDRTPAATLSSWAMRARLPWMRVVQLAEQLEAARATPGDIDPEIATRLADAVLDFQQQLLGGERSITARTPNGIRQENGIRPGSDRAPGGADASEPDTPHPPWAVVVDLARRLDAECAEVTAVDVAIAVRLARAVLVFHENLGSAVVGGDGRKLDSAR